MHPAQTDRPIPGIFPPRFKLKPETQTPTVPHVSDSHRLNISEAERRKRTATFTRPPETILVKVFSVQHLFEKGEAPFFEGFRRTDRKDAEIEQKHVELAAERNVDAYAYGRERDVEIDVSQVEAAPDAPKADAVKIADTGLCLFDKQANVFAGDLVAELFDAGYIVVDLHAFMQANKGSVHVITFKKRVDASTESLQVPPTVWRLLRGSRFNNGTIWCNLKPGEDGKVTRLDTVTLAKPFEVEDLGRHFHKNGNSYTLTEE